MHRIKKIWSIFTLVCVVVVVILAILLAGVRLIGLKPYVVLSGSMEPEYPVGSMIYTKKVDPADLEVGDPLTFQLSSGAVATHRIVEILPPENAGGQIQFRTKGDANQNADSAPVPAERVLGKPLFCIPLLGFVAEYIQRPPGLYVAVGIGIVVIILSFVTDQLPSKKGKYQENNSMEEEL